MEKIERKAMRKQFSTIGWVLLLVILGMNLCVYVCAILDVAILTITGNTQILSNEQALSDRLMQNGWGYLLTIALGLLLLYLWKGKGFFRGEVWKRGRPMKPSSFLMLTSLFLGCQLLFQLIATGMEAFLNQFELSAQEALESATLTCETLSMFLYACIGAPIWEELLFRGVILRTLEPHGKRLAIWLSALMFGLFHGNLVQIPYAFGVGLVLGYVAVEYNIGWAIVLHTVNNLVLSDFLTRITMNLPAGVANLILWGLILVMFVVGVICLIACWREVRTYHRQNPINWKKILHFFTSPGVITAIIILIFLTVLPLAMQML